MEPLDFYVLIDDLRSSLRRAQSHTQAAQQIVCTPEHLQAISHALQTARDSLDGIEALVAQIGGRK